jgi:hypothetical protein
MERLATSNGRLETLLAKEVVEPHTTPPSTTVATHAELVKGPRRRQNKHRESRRHVTKRSIDWKLVFSNFEPMHARFYFTLEGCADDEGLTSHGDLPQCSRSDSILESEFNGERVFLNPPWELAEHIGRNFESCRRTTPISTMVVFVLPKWAKFNELT